MGNATSGAIQAPFSQPTQTSYQPVAPDTSWTNQGTTAQVQGGWSNTPSQPPQAMPVSGAMMAQDQPQAQYQGPGQANWNPDTQTWDQVNGSANTPTSTPSPVAGPIAPSPVNSNVDTGGPQGGAIPPNSQSNTGGPTPPGWVPEGATLSADGQLWQGTDKNGQQYAYGVNFNPNQQSGQLQSGPQPLTPNQPQGLMNGALHPQVGFGCNCQQ